MRHTPSAGRLERAKTIKTSEGSKHYFLAKLLNSELATRSTKLHAMRRAVIDIGTNTVKLLVADVQDGEVRPVLSKDATTRLGEGVNETRLLSGIAIARTVRVIDEFLATTKAQGAGDVIALTTSAARDAMNRDEFLAGVRDKCGLEVRVITGEHEAALIFRGVGSDQLWTDTPLLVLDVGGGSAELIRGQSGKIEECLSLPLGAVRLTELFAGKHFAAMTEHIRAAFHAAVTPDNAPGRRMIGTGGSITTLARMECGEVDHAVLTQDKLREWVTRLNAMSLAQRRKVPGLPPERADIIVAGGLLFVLAMESLGAYELTVSIRNLRYGALLEWR